MTRPSRRPALMLVLAPLAATLALTGCGGGKDDKPKAKASSGQPGAPADSTEGAPQPKGAPLPKVEPGQVKRLVGKWVSEGPTKDYFVFKPDGTASWIARGRPLWTGQVIPDGKDKFRFSWEGSDPQQASYWGVTVNPNGKTLVFPGTQLTYTKEKAKA